MALRPSRPTETSDFYELIVERHKRTSTLITSHRSPDEWLAMTSDALLAQSAVDRYTSTAHTLIIQGPFYRQGTGPDSPPPLTTRNADRKDE